MSNNTQSRTPIQSDPAQETSTMTMDVRIHTLNTGGNVLANASVTLNSCFAVRGIKVVGGEKGPFVSMPSYRGRDGYKDVCFPCTKEFRQQFQQTVLDAYQQALTQLPQRQHEVPQEQEAPPTPQMSM